MFRKSSPIYVEILRLKPKDRTAKIQAHLWIFIYPLTDDTSYIVPNYHLHLSAILPIDDIKKKKINAFCEKNLVGNS